MAACASRAAHAGRASRSSAPGERTGASGTIFVNLLTSIVIACYNAASTICEAIDSALGQTAAVEVIVADDGSTDGSADIVATYGDRIHFLRVEHGGAPKARNAGLARARGSRVLFLDADDMLPPDAIENLGRHLHAAAPRSIGVAPWQYLVHDRGVWRAERADLGAPPAGDPLAGWLVGIYHPPAALLWPAELVRDLGGWDETLTQNQDGDLAMRALAAGAGLVHGDGAPVLYRQHGPRSRSISAAADRTSLESRVRVLEKVAAELAARGRLETYRIWIARSYHDIGRLYLYAEPEVARECLRRGHELAGDDAVWGPWTHRLLVRSFGLEGKERIAAALARVGIARSWRRRHARTT